MIARLREIENGQVFENDPLRKYTRFDLGGPAAVLFDTEDEAAFVEALQLAAQTDMPHLVIGGGTNLVVADEGFEGLVLRYRGAAIRRDGMRLIAAAGAVLQHVVDASIGYGLQGMATMTGIPGYLGGAVYGNAGAYGNSMDEVMERVRVFADGEVRTMSNEECEFTYRESVFKKQKEWIVLGAELRFAQGDRDELQHAAHGIRKVRDAKYPPEMKCAGSIFKNLFLKNLPPAVVCVIPPAVTKGGKVPSAWFLEQVGAKGLRRGEIQVATYHANLIYNDGVGATRDLVSIIHELQGRVCDRFGILLEEEVQYVG